MQKLNIKKNIITIKTFLAFVFYTIYLIWSTPDLTELIVGMVVAAAFIVLGIEKPVLTKFAKDIGLVMIDQKSDTATKMQKLRSIWVNFSAVWVEVSEMLMKEEKKIEETEFPDTIE